MDKYYLRRGTGRGLGLVLTGLGGSTRPRTGFAAARVARDVVAVVADERVIRSGTVMFDLVLGFVPVDRDPFFRVGGGDGCRDADSVLVNIRFQVTYR